jgi:hypothetical protein
MAVPSEPPTFLAAAPRFVDQNVAQALAFCGQLGVETPYRVRSFAVIARDGVALHFNLDPDAAPVTALRLLDRRHQQRRA